MLSRFLLGKFFKEATRHAALARVDSESVMYMPVDGAPPEDVLEEHLHGEAVIGAYTITSTNRVWWCCWDVDSSDLERARNITRMLHEKLDLIPAVEFSGGKGFHLYIFFTESLESEVVHRFGIGVREQLQIPAAGDPHVEFFPKQPRLGSGEMGNLVKLPLGRHGTTLAWSTFVDPADLTTPIDAVGAIEAATITPEQFHVLAPSASMEERIVNLLSPYWVDGNRHNLALALSGYLALVGFPEERTSEVIRSLIQDYGGDERNLLECVEDTYRKVAADERVAGLGTLFQMLPQATVSELTSILGTADRVLITKIDGIRREKIDAFRKPRKAAQLILAQLQSDGKLIRSDEKVYWLDHTSRQVIELATTRWESMLLIEAGINTAESFGRQVMQAVLLTAREIAQPAKVHHRFFWDVQQECLFVHLGGASMYKLDGTEVQCLLNGQEDVFFTGDFGIEREMPDLTNQELAVIDPWPLLTDDLSFAQSVAGAARPSQQRELLKAWILSTFFAEAMPTRPILTFIAPAGAGKTTAARRILRFFEGPEEDVLGLITDKADSLRASVQTHRVLVLDNMERTNASWLVDMLNRLSTGSHLEIRKLYTDNTMIKIKPNCFLICTAIQMPFSDESIFTRMLPIELAQLVTPLPEFHLQDLLRRNMAGIWRGMFAALNEVIQLLKANVDVDLPSTTRLADFSVFCRRIASASFLRGDELLAGLLGMGNRQQLALRESSPFVQVLELWANQRPHEASGWNTLPHLYSKLSQLARQSNITWRWTTPSGLGRHIEMLLPHLARMGFERKLSPTPTGEEILYRISTGQPSAGSD